MATKRQTIKRLLRPDYSFPVLQELLAEILYETQKFNKRDIEKRYDDLLRIVLGSPQKKLKHKGYIDDEPLLSRAAIMVLSYKLSEGQACEEIAKQAIISGYRFRSKTMPEVNDAQMQAIDSLKKRLLRKLKGKTKEYASMHKQQILEATRLEETHDDELIFVADWLKRYVTVKE